MHEARNLSQKKCAPTLLQGVRSLRDKGPRGGRGGKGGEGRHARVKQYGSDSTIAPPQNQRYSLTNVSWPAPARHKEGYIWNQSIQCFLVCKGLSIDNVGVSRNTAFREIRQGTGFETGVFREIRQGAGFETGDFVIEKLGGLP